MKFGNHIFSKIDIAVFLYLLYICFYVIFRGNPYGTDRCFVFILIVASYFVLSILFRFRKCRHILAISLSSALVIEITLAFLQIIGLLDNGNVYFLFGGSFGNPGVLASFICLIYPYVLTGYLINKKKAINSAKCQFLMTLTILSIFFLILSKSRCSWIAVIISTIFILNRYRHNILSNYFPEKNTTKRILCILIFVVVAFLLYIFKPYSSFGRLLIWKISLLTPNNHIWFGNGFSSFSSQYGRWQANYFLNSKYSEIEKYVADYVTCAYNEFIELFIEQGIVGVILFVIVVICLFKITGQKTAMYASAKASAISFIVLCLFSFPLNTNMLLCIGIFNLSLLASSQHKDLNFAKERFGILLRCAIFIVVMLGIAHPYYIFQKSKVLFDKGQYYYNNRNYEESLTCLDKACSYNPNNGRFLSFYAFVLYELKQYDKSILIFEHSIQKCSDPNVYMNMGDNYVKIEDYRNAEISYSLSSAITPYRIMPQYKLVKLYIKQGKMDLARGIAKSVLGRKSKIDSIVEQDIRLELNSLINE